MTKPTKWCAPSEYSDQPEHSPSLISLCLRSVDYGENWSDWADTQADLSTNLPGAQVILLVLSCRGSIDKGWTCWWQKIHPYSFVRDISVDHENCIYDNIIDKHNSSTFCIFFHIHIFWSCHVHLFWWMLVWYEVSTFSLWLNFKMFVCCKMSHVMRKPVYAICEQRRRRSACASAQSDQHLCC